MAHIIKSNDNRVRKLIDLEKEVIKRLAIQSIEHDYPSVKAYLEYILISQSTKRP